MSYRNIIVEGVKYRYSVGKHTTTIRRPDNTVLVKVPSHELAGETGLTADTFDRGQWKRSGDGMVRPGRVAERISLELEKLRVAKLKPARLTPKQIRAALKRGQRNAEALEEVLDSVFAAPCSTLVMRVLRG